MSVSEEKCSALPAAGPQPAKDKKKADKKGTSEGSATTKENEPSSAMKAAKKAAKAEKKRKREAGKAAASDAPSEIKEDSEERPAKKKKKSKGEKVSRAVSDPSESVASLVSPGDRVLSEATSKRKKSKARKTGNQADEAEESSPSTHKERHHKKSSEKRENKKKDKKGKREAEEESADAKTDATLQPEKASKKDRKARAEREGPNGGTDTPAPGLVEGAKVKLDEGVASEPKDRAAKKLKKVKHSNKSVKEGRASEATASKHKSGTEMSGGSDANTPVDASSKWNVSNLGGGNARQAKFLKLLGGKKNGISLAPATTGTRGDKAGLTKQDIDRVESDLSRQYDAGVRQKFEHDGPRRGLGA